MKTKSGKRIPGPLGPPYTSQCKWPKWYGLTTPLATGEPGCLRRIGAFSNWTKADHLDAARAHAIARERAAVDHGCLTKEAMDRYGDHGSLISGVMRDHFPPHVKDRLRHLAALGAHGSVARLHWKMAGKRRPYHPIMVGIKNPVTSYSADCPPGRKKKG